VKLSIATAAREHPDRPGLITASHVYTFSELGSSARAAAPGPARLIADASVDTLLAIYAALEERRPLVLVHPRALAAPEPTAPLPPDTLAVLYTSGSTAAPRGVILSRAGFLAAAAASAANLGDRDDDRWLLCLPLAHAGGLGVALRALAARRPLILHEGNFEPSQVAALATSASASLASRCAGTMAS